MHFLVIIILLCVVFPTFARLVGGVLKGFFLFVLVLLAIGLFGGLSH